MICYLDTSAALKLLVEEAESAALTTYLRSGDDERQLVAAWLLHTELHFLAGCGPTTRCT